ncbi:pentapeptide repeat-containing protein [Streptomyces sp. NPDC055189]
MLLGVKTMTKRNLFAVLAALGSVGYALLLWRGPWWVDGAHLRTKDLQPADGVVITGFRTAVVALGAGFIAALGLYYTHRSHKHAEKLYEQSQEQFAHARDKDRELADLTREGHLTERYTEAIKLLSTSDRTEMMARLGGIYSLERIMRDSPKDHETVIQVLAAFVRKNASLPDPGEPDPDDLDIPWPPDDVQAALTVLGRRPDRREHQVLDLSFTNLRRVDLSGAYLRNANLTCTELGGADLRRAVLTFAKLGAVDFTGSRLKNADLRNADLVCNVTPAKLSVEQLLETEFDASTQLPPELEQHPNVNPPPTKTIRLFLKDR